MIDNTKGEIKLVRGSGPPMLTVEGDQIEIDNGLYVLATQGLGCLPRLAKVIGIDLTRRTVRLQIVGERELLYSADAGRVSVHGTWWLFTEWENARLNSVLRCETQVKACEKYADEAIDRLEKAKSTLDSTKKWEPKQR